MAYLFSQRFTRAETQRLEESPKTWPRSNQVQILAAASLRQGRQRLHATRQSSEAAQMDTPTVIANSPGVHICCNVHTGMELRVRARLGPSLVRVRDAEAKQPGSAKRDMNVEHFFSNTLDFGACTSMLLVLACSTIYTYLYDNDISHQAKVLLVILVLTTGVRDPRVVLMSMLLLQHRTLLVRVKNISNTQSKNSVLDGH